MVPPPLAATNKQSGGDAHLRSAEELIGYSVAADDGIVGEVVDFLIDGRTWMIREVAVECGHWYDGKKVIVPTEKLARIDYELSTVHVDSTRQAFANASQQHHQAHGA